MQQDGAKSGGISMTKTSIIIGANVTSHDTKIRGRYYFSMIQKYCYNSQLNRSSKNYGV